MSDNRRAKAQRSNRAGDKANKKAGLGATALANTNSERNNHPGNQREEPVTRLERAGHWVTILGTFAAIGGLIYSFHRDTRVTQIEQRAWIGVSEWALDREPEDGSTITIRAILSNTGATPATNVITKSRLHVWDRPIFDEWDSVKADQSGSTILPDASGHGVNKTVRIDKPGMAAAYKDNKVRVYFTGRINYNDVFGRPHWTTFCAYHTYGQDLKLFNVCPTGNEMDLEDY